MSERLQSPGEREILIRTSLTEDIERWQVESQFPPDAIDRAVQIILAKEIDLQGDIRHALEQRRYKARKEQSA